MSSQESLKPQDNYGNEALLFKADNEIDKLNSLFFDDAFIELLQNNSKCDSKVTNIPAFLFDTTKNALPQPLADVLVLPETFKVANLVAELHEPNPSVPEDVEVGWLSIIQFDADNYHITINSNPKKATMVARSDFGDFEYQPNIHPATCADLLATFAATVRKDFVKPQNIYLFDCQKQIPDLLASIVGTFEAIRHAETTLGLHCPVIKVGNNALKISYETTLERDINYKVMNNYLHALIQFAVPTTDGMIVYEYTHHLRDDVPPLEVNFLTRQRVYAEVDQLERWQLFQSNPKVCDPVEFIDNVHNQQTWIGVMRLIRRHLEIAINQNYKKPSTLRQL